MTDNQIKNDLTHAITVSPTYLDSWICQVRSHNGNEFNGDFYLIRCTKEDVRVKEFVKGIYNLIIDYAVKRKEIPSDMKTIDATALTKKARQRFVTSNKSGEAGELILFALLETQKNAPQLLNKMALKTARQLHYHGLDAIHISSDGNNIKLYYGESKLHKDRTSGINDAIAQLEEFHQNLNDEDFELDLISSNIDAEKFGDSVELIMKYLNPYTKDKTNLSKRYAIFIGYDWDKLMPTNILQINGELEETLKQLFLSEINNIILKCSQKCQLSILNGRIDFFFIPFPSVEEFRTYFQEEIS